MGQTRPHVPYRNSMMTTVLRDSLGGNCRTVMIANITGEQGQLDESISTCRFAQRVAMVSNEVGVAPLQHRQDPCLTRPLPLCQELRGHHAPRGGAGVQQSLGGTLEVFRSAAGQRPVSWMVQAVLNEELDPDLVIKRLKQEIRELKDEIRCGEAGQVAGSSHSLQAFRPCTPSPCAMIGWLQ